jgi:hypothetical protein
VSTRDGAEECVPIRPAEPGGRAQGGDGILFRFVKHEVVNIIHVELAREIDINFNSMVNVLLLDCLQERVEPYHCSEIAYYPNEIDLQTR